MATSVSGKPTSLDSGYQAASIANSGNALNYATNTTYATINLTTGANAVTQVFYSFGFNIPTTATIDSVSCSVKVYINTTTSSRVSSRQVQLYSGSTAKGTAKSISNSTSAGAITTGTWTASELNNAKIRLYAVRGTSNTSNNYFIRFYGCTFNVTYTEASTGNKVYIKSGGTWKEASKIYVKVGGTWKEVSKAYKKVNGSWVEQSDKSAMFDPNAIYVGG